MQTFTHQFLKTNKIFNEFHLAKISKTVITINGEI